MCITNSFSELAQRSSVVVFLAEQIVRLVVDNQGDYLYDDSLKGNLLEESFISFHGRRLYHRLLVVYVA